MIYRIYRHLLLCMILAVGALVVAPQAQAQSLSSVLSQSNTVEEASGEGAAAPADLAEALRIAAETGGGIVVIDTNGKVITEATGAPEAEEATSPMEQASQLMKVQESADHIRDVLLERLRDLPGALIEVDFILRDASPDGTLFFFVKILFYSLVLFAAGALVEHFVYGYRITRQIMTARMRENPIGYREKMPFLVFRFLLALVGILISMAVAYVLGLLLFPPLNDSAVQFTVTLINVAYFGCRVTASLWRMILSPYVPQYRIPHFSDKCAKRLHRWMWILGSFDICAILFGTWIGELGLNYDIYALMASLMSGVVVVLNIMLVLRNRSAISNALRRGKPIDDVNMLLRLLSRAWAPAVVAYVVLAWFVLTIDLVLERPNTIPLIAGAYGILISIIVVYGVVNYLIERGFARARVLRAIRLQQAKIEAAEQERLEAEAHARRIAEEGGADGEADPETAIEADTPAGPLAARVEPALATTRVTGLSDTEREVLEQGDGQTQPVRVLNSFEALARRVAGILAFVAGAYAFFYIWDNDSARMVESVLDQVLDVIIIIFVGYVVYHAFRIWIDTKIAEEVGDAPEEGEMGDEGSADSSASRLATLLPLFRNFILIVVVVTIALIVLMEIGVNVGPLFAGAGIVGVAVGFGSQALVRDIFAGAFFLFDDAFRKGEYLDVGGVKGTVEKISVRSFQLRHHLGALHTIPFGELQVMTNYSRDWVIMKLPLRVTYDTDVEKVRKLIKNLGVKLLDDPVIGANFIAPLKSQGVIEMQDSAMIIRVKFMTKPGDQWLVRKRVYEDIRELFEQEGIKFAHREVTVRLADGKVEDLTNEQKRKVAAAAHASIEDVEDEDSDAGGDDR